MSLVRLTDRWAKDSTAKKLPFIADMPLVFLGAIPNKPGHGVFIGHKRGRVYSGHHISKFVELSEDEV
ncbi:MAG TPA: hypothetical protein VHL34_07610 [Rhizomicrobium sp.]|jgi:hypothetical protein|nr:hypothetical protein [Rhizomicrobium sp.]